MTFNISRFRNIEQHTYECEVVTPMFLSGADQSKAELRTQSINGVLRFWWRAMYGRNYSLDEMKQKEAEIFGSTDRKSYLVIEIADQNIQVSGDKLHRSGYNTLNYLAYGYDDNKGNIRKHIVPGSTFTLKITFPEKVKNEMRNAFNFFMTFGGLGSRSRNGFGSLYSSQTDSVDIIDFISSDSEMKEFTSLSKESRILRFDAKQTWKDALMTVGEAYKNARYQMKLQGKNRAYIGKPFNRDNSRYAKPLFISINKEQGGYRPQILYLPSIYQDGRNQQSYLSACNFLIDEIERGSQ